MDGIIISPVAKDSSEVPIVSLSEYLLPALRENAAKLGATTWVVSTALYNFGIFCLNERCCFRKTCQQGRVSNFVTLKNNHVE